MQNKLSGLTLFVFLFTIALGANAQGDVNCEDGVCSTRYEVAFFDAYAPITALDLIDNLPGFTLDNGNQSTRGFSGGAGNILINGIRLSTKSESPRDQLRSIPVQTVVAIEVLRGNLGKFDLANQSVVANIIRKEDISGSGTIEVQARQAKPSSKIKPRAEVNYSSSFGNTDYNVNLIRRHYERINDRTESLSDGMGDLLELRTDQFQEEGKFNGLSFNTQSSFENFQFNTNFKYEDFDEAGGRTSLRRPVDAENFEAFFLDIDVFDGVEFGFDIQSNLTDKLSAKLIAITIDNDFKGEGGLTRTLTNNDVINDSAFTITEQSGEDIVRLELDYSGWEDNQVQLSIEGTVNELKSNFALLTDQDGVLTPVAVDGAVTDVKEERIDVRLTNSFIAYGFNVEASIGAEDSTIKQTGGFEASRSFFYLKPSLTISKSLSENRQIQARIFRTVGQLNFGDFTSSVDLGDDQLSLGNPSLEPEKITTFDVRYEQRFTGVGAINVTLFYDLVDDVEDQIPLRDTLEVPGNIGNGYRVGVRGDFTLPMTLIGLENARIDARFTYQDSEVTDPVTGDDRIFTNFEPWEYEVEFRQDLNTYNFAWGLTYFADANREFFGIDEYSTFGEEYQWSAFAEKRFGQGLKVTLDLRNFNRGGESRTRTVFDGRRGISSILTQELRDSEYARRINLSVSKTF